jgi:hypothetical protein
MLLDDILASITLWLMLPGSQPKLENCPFSFKPVEVAKMKKCVTSGMLDADAAAHKCTDNRLFSVFFSVEHEYQFPINVFFSILS